MRRARAIENGIVPSITAGLLKLARMTHFVGPHLA
jgi:hypothetical protein